MASGSQLEAKRPPNAAPCRRRLCARADPPGELLEELAFGDLAKLGTEVFTRPYPQAGAPDMDVSVQPRPRLRPRPRLLWGNDFPKKDPQELTC